MAGIERAGLSKKVMIRVRTGSNGRSLKSLMVLHGKRGRFNVDMTWADAFQLKFGVTVDTERFLIARAYGGYRPSPVKHSLLEKISVVIGEFKRDFGVYNVYVVRNVLDRSMKNGEVIAPKPMPTTTLKPTSKPKTRSTSKPTTRPTSKPKTRSTSKPTTRPTSMPTTRSSSTSSKAVFGRVCSRVFSRRVINVKVADKGPPDIGGSGSRRRREAIIGKNFENAGTRKRKRTPSVRVTTPTVTATTTGMAMPTVSGTTTAVSPKITLLEGFLQDCRRYRGVGDVENSLPVDDGNDVEDNDFRSETSSQDSQEGYLRQLGIVIEDIRTGIVADAKRNFTNTQFLRAQHELLMLKADKMNWSKWMLIAPHTTNILREVFNV